MKRPDLALHALLIFSTGATAACSGSKAAARTAVDLPTVAVVRAERTDLMQMVTLAAEFRPFQEIDVHAKVAGYLKAIYVDVGDLVKAGQLLAVLEVPELQNEIEEDDATIRRNSEEIKRARADLERSESAHEVAHLGSTRLAAVLKTRPTLIAQQDLDEAAARDRIAEAQVSTAKAAVAAAEQQLAVSQAAAGKSRTLVEYTRITAPFAGVVTHRYADTGAMIQAGTSSQTQAMPVVKLSEADKLRLTIAVPESAVSRISVGQNVEVRVDSLQRTFPGSIARSAGKVNPETRTMETEVDVENRDRALVPGMYAYASIALQRVAGVIALPVQAIDRGENASMVYLERQSIPGSNQLLPARRRADGPLLHSQSIPGHRDLSDRERDRGDEPGAHRPLPDH
jgi:multidrug efflux pump subunit AcrA (membrane-fusion protein)